MSNRWGLDFGQNIENNRIRRQQIAAQMYQANQQAALQARSQDIQAAQSAANRSENARQFDAQMEDREANRSENARQFDAQMEDREANRSENARQFDAQQKLKENDSLWANALKEQEIENKKIAFETQSAELDRIMKIKAMQDEQIANRQAMIESGYGNMAIVANLQNGIVTDEQVNDFNSNNGTEYNYIGEVDPMTGRQFSDGKLHFVKYVLDGNGRVAIDQKSGSALVEIDNPLNSQFRNNALKEYFGNFGEYSSRGRDNSGLTFDERMALQDAKDSAMKDRLDSSNDARKRLRYAGDLSKRISDLNKEKVALEKDTVSKVSDPVGHKERLVSLEDKISTLESERDGMFNDDNAESTETTDVPRVYKGRLDIPGIDGLFAPNEVFEAGGKKWTWDGKSDGNLQSHIKEVQ